MVRSSTGPCDCFSYYICTFTGNIPVPLDPIGTLKWILLFSKIQVQNILNDPVDNEKEVDYGFESNFSGTSKESKYSVDEEAMIGYFEIFL